MDKKVMLNVRIPRSEMEILEAFCDRGGRTKTDVIREFIRSLETSAEKEESAKEQGESLPGI